MMNGKEQRKVHGNKASAGIAYVYIPPDQDRDKFVRDAYRTGSLTIINDFSERMDNVRVSKHVMNDIEFPSDSEKLGSMVLWVNVPKNNQPVIVAVVPKGNEIYEFLEHQFSIRKTFGDSTIDISGDAESGSLIINVFSKAKSPRIDMNVMTPNKDAQLNLKVAGSLKAIVENKAELEAAKEILMRVVDREEDDEKLTELKYVLGEGFKYVDEFGNEILATEDSVNVKAAKSVMLGEGKEPVVLGDTLASLLSDMLSAISSITTATSIGAQPIINKATFEQLKERVDEIKSEYSSTD